MTVLHELMVRRIEKLLWFGVLVPWILMFFSINPILSIAIGLTTGSLISTVILCLVFDRKETIKAFGWLRWRIRQEIAEIFHINYHETEPV